MARFNTDGLENLIRDMERSAAATSEIVEEMLFAGAEEVKGAWQDSIKKHNIRDTGNMLESVDFPRKVTKIGSVRSVDIYPQGYASKNYTDKRTGKTYTRYTKIRNAERAFIIHYGVHKKSGRKSLAGYKVQPTWFVDDADEASGPRVERRLIPMWDQHLKKHNL